MHSSFWSLKHCQEARFFPLLTEQIPHAGEKLVHRDYRIIQQTSLRDAIVHFEIPNFGKPGLDEIREDWGYEGCRLALEYNQNVVTQSLSIKLLTGLLYYCQPFHCPTSVQCLELNWKVEYSNTNQAFMPESYNILVQYIDSNHYNTFLDQVATFPV